MAFETAAPLIRGESNQNCCLCQTPSEPLYEGVRDRLFHTPGEWTIRRCLAADCGLLWLDPMPAKEDLAALYETYNTHASSEQPPTLLSFKRRMAALCRSSYLAWRLNYGPDVGKSMRWALGLPLLISRIECDTLEIPLRYLVKEKRGRMLEIGCGNGEVLRTAQGLGWNVEGVDFDAQAVEAANHNGLTVRLGYLADQQYSSNSFDFILMSHVIEHIHDPISTLSEVHRILKPGGMLVVLTPNSDSWGHRRFGANWFGLESPRHLQIFNKNTLKMVSQRAGFDLPVCSSTLRITPIIFVQSGPSRASLADLLKPPTRSEVLYARAGTVAELFMRIWDPFAGEELLMEAIR